MPLSEQRRRQLDEIVVKMANQNAPKEDVVAIVNDFKSKFENEGVSSVQPNNPLAPVMTQQKQVVLPLNRRNRTNLGCFVARLALWEMLL